MSGALRLTIVTPAAILIDAGDVRSCAPRTRAAPSAFCPATPIS